MNQKPLFMRSSPALLAAILAVSFLAGCKEHGNEKEPEKGPESKSRVSRAPSGEPAVTLDAETQKRMELKTELLLSTNLNREWKGYGRVLDPAPLAGLVTDLASARVASETSSQELARLKTLHAQNQNVSTRVLQAAEAAARRDGLTVQSLLDKLRLSWGPALAEQKDLGLLVESLVALENALVRVDLPAGETLPSPPISARLVAVLQEENPVAAEFLGPVTGVDPQTQGQGFLFLVKPNRLRLAPGAAVTGYVQISGAPEKGMIVPRSAVVRHQGRAWVYVQRGDSFLRREISLDRALPQGWFIASGVSPAERVVVRSVQTVLSEELKEQIQAD